MKRLFLYLDIILGDSKGVKVRHPRERGDPGV